MPDFSMSLAFHNLFIFNLKKNNKNRRTKKKEEEDEFLYKQGRKKSQVVFIFFCLRSKEFYGSGFISINREKDWINS